MNAKDKPVISIKDLVVGFGDQTVLDHLSLDVRKGEILGVVGKSGGGKSVLLRTIIGLLPKWHGKIEVLGVDLDTATEQERRALERRWGVLFQQGALFSSLTVRQNVQFPMRENLEISQRLMDEMALAKLDMVGLTPIDAEKFPSELSGGMTKRVALARALALDPGDRVPRRADLGPRSDRRRRFRRADQDLAADARADRVHDHPRPRQPEHRLRPHRRARRRKHRRHGADGNHARMHASLGPDLFSG